MAGWGSRTDDGFVEDMSSGEFPGPDPAFLSVFEIEKIGPLVFRRLTK
jgi:hypothetical protein